MIDYDPGKWSVLFAFSLTGSVFPKAFAWALPTSVVALVLHISFENAPVLKAVLGAGDVAAGVLSGFTTILGFLVVFRSQQAYSRWWEGGTLLQQLRGEWFNSYSCLLAFCNASKEKTDEVQKFQHQLVRLFSLLYGCALQQASTMQEKRFELIDVTGFEEESLKHLQACPDRVEVVLQWLQRLIVESDAAGILKIAPPILSRVFNELGNGIVNLNNARKIKEFPIPFPLAQMATVMLIFHAIVTPVISAASCQNRYWASIITFVVIFSYWSINYIAVELEMPFGEDLNDLPLHEMQRDMNRSLRTLITGKSQRVPVFYFDAEAHLEIRTRVIDFEDDFVEYGKQAAWLQERGIDINQASRSSLPMSEKQLAKPADTKPTEVLNTAKPAIALNVEAARATDSQTEAAIEAIGTISTITADDGGEPAAQAAAFPKDQKTGMRVKRPQAGIKAAPHDANNDGCMLHSSRSSSGNKPIPTFGKAQTSQDKENDFVDHWFIPSELDGDVGPNSSRTAPIELDAAPSANSTRTNWARDPFALEAQFADAGPDLGGREGHLSDGAGAGLESRAPIGAAQL